MTTRVAAAKAQGNRFTRFFSGLWSEMKKVVWLSRQEALYLSALVLIATIVSGIILYGFDFGFSTAVDKLLLGR